MVDKCLNNVNMIKVQNEYFFILFNVVHQNRTDVDSDVTRIHGCVEGLGN